MDVKQELLDLGEALQIDGNPVFNTVFYGSNFEANNSQADEKAYPFFQLAKILTAGFDINDKTGRQQDKWNVFIFMADKAPATDLDTTAELEAPIIEAMRIACKTYIASLIKSNKFEVPTRVEMKNLSFEFDSSCSGVLAFFTLKERHGKIICY